MKESTQKYAFILGREHEICLEELKSVLSRLCFYFSASTRQRRDWDIYRISGNVAFAKIENFSSSDVSRLMDQLSGTIKIYEIVGSLGNNIPEKIASLILQKKANATNKINFGVSCFNKELSIQQIGSFALTAKKRLKGRFSLRYVESRDGAELSSILTLKNNLLEGGIELGIFDEEIGVLVALNNPEEWNRRDYGKPASDKFSGMAPPKLARMLVNLSLGQANSNVQNKNVSNIEQLENSDLIRTSDFEYLNLKQSIIIDCFCGSGNILLEALMLGCNVIGSDISLKAVRDSEQNCKWLIEQMIKIQETRNKQIPNLKSQITDKSQLPKFKVFNADATNFDYIKLLNSECSMLNACHKNLVFVTEPYLGEPKKYKPSRSATVGEYKKVKELYLMFLENIAKLLNCSIARGQGSVLETNKNSTIEQFNNCTLCLVFPLVETLDGGRYSLFSDCVDEITKLGYTQTRSNFVYGREYQVVKREIISLKLKVKI